MMATGQAAVLTVLEIPASVSCSMSGSGGATTMMTARRHAAPKNTTRNAIPEICFGDSFRFFTLHPFSFQRMGILAIDPQTFFRGDRARWSVTRLARRVCAAPNSCYNARVAMVL